MVFQCLSSLFSVASQMDCQVRGVIESPGPSHLPKKWLIHVWNAQFISISHLHVLHCWTHTSFDKRTSENKHSSQEPGPTSTAFSVAYTFESTEVDLEAEWQLVWQQQWQLGMWSTFNLRWKPAEEILPFWCVVAITIISRALLPSLPPLPRCDLGSACTVWNVVASFWKVTEHVPHHAGVGSGWFGREHFISFYPMLHAVARSVAQWLSEHIVLTMTLHDFVGKPGCRELSCMSSPHCGSTSPVRLRTKAIM